MLKVLLPLIAMFDVPVDVKLVDVDVFQSVPEPMIPIFPVPQVTPRVFVLLELNEAALIPIEPNAKVPWVSVSEPAVELKPEPAVVTVIPEPLIVIGAVKLDEKLGRAEAKFPVPVSIKEPIVKKYEDEFWSTANVPATVRLVPPVMVVMFDELPLPQ
jgi:hypothetical protein